MAKCPKKWEFFDIKSSCALERDHYGPVHIDKDGRPFPDTSLRPLPLGPEE